LREGFFFLEFSGASPSHIYEPFSTKLM